MICTKCLKEKDLEEFSFRDLLKVRRHRACKACHQAYRKQHYLQNRQKYLVKAEKWNKKQKHILENFLFTTLSQKMCIDCGENDILVLDFDHVSNKSFGIAQMFKNRYSVEAIKNELSKCVVRCANCHRRKTAVETGYWKYKLLKELNIGA